jgi:hypothetical protein
VMLGSEKKLGGGGQGVKKRGWGLEIVQIN